MTSISRRELLPYFSALLAAARSTAEAQSLNPDTLTKFVDALPIPAIARSQGTRAVPGHSGVKAPYYRVAMRQIEAKLHRDLPPARQWVYGNTCPGPTFEMRRGQGAWIEWANELPTEHFLPVDHHIHGAESDKPDVRAIVHVHGAKVPPESDGWPENWYLPGKSMACYYPNDQDAAMLWYHDHTMGINRLNVYAGMFGLYLVRDEAEEALHLPSGKYEIPLAICDRRILTNGQLEYPVSGIPDAPWVPEVFGEAFLVNGKLFPYCGVEPRAYRFRVVNVSNGRFLHLFLSNHATMQQVASDQGLLGAPAPVEAIQLAPGERADLVIDFSAHAGEQLILNNDSFDVMQFRVGKTASAPAAPLPAKLRSVPRTPESSAVKTRELTIIEDMNKVKEPMMMMLNGMHWDAPITEKPVLNSTEIWSFINTTEDTHPIHLHLVRFQILDRRAFDVFDYQTKGQMRYISDAVPPAPPEAGWKDTVRVDAAMVTRIIVRFEGYLGRYVWHCHVLEHEDNEMMRPYEVVTA